MRGVTTDELDAWYRSLGSGTRDSARTDRYLLVPDDAVNIKARSLSTLERKCRLDRVALGDVVPGIEGFVERWRKEPIAASAVDVSAGTWLRVDKRRRIRHEAGCTVELTDVHADGQRWRTLALEADEATVGRDGLVAALEVLGSSGVGRHFELSAGSSHGYPRQLRELAPRSSTVA